MKKFDEMKKFARFLSENTELNYENSVNVSDNFLTLKNGIKNFLRESETFKTERMMDYVATVHATSICESVYSDDFSNLMENSLQNVKELIVEDSIEDVDLWEDIITENSLPVVSNYPRRQMVRTGNNQLANNDKKTPPGTTKGGNGLGKLAVGTGALALGVKGVADKLGERKPEPEPEPAPEGGFWSKSIEALNTQFGNLTSKISENPAGAGIAAAIAAAGLIAGIIAVKKGGKKGREAKKAALTKQLSYMKSGLSKVKDPKEKAKLQAKISKYQQKLSKVS